MVQAHQAERPKTADERQRAEHRRRHDAHGPKRPTDARLTMEITTRLTHHPDLDAKGIDVVVDQGAATLLGTVCGEASKQLAETLVRSVPGIAGVTNELRTDR